jgi:hypothetical protein
MEQFQIASIRLVRDCATGMGKGFGYVNFASADSVETAIQVRKKQTRFMKVIRPFGVFYLWVYLPSGYISLLRPKFLLLECGRLSFFY